MSKRRQYSSESTFSRKNQLDMRSILISAILGAIIEILLERLFIEIYHWGIHKKIIHSIVRAKLFIYNPNYRTPYYNESIEPDYCIIRISKGWYVETRIFGKFVRNKRVELENRRKERRMHAYNESRDRILRDAIIW